MNETSSSNPFFNNNVCRVCLKTTNEVSQMSGEHIDLFRTIVDEVAHEEYDMKTCSMCHWMFRKFSKFKHHCQLANNLLKEVVYMDPKSLAFLKKINCHNLTQRLLETYHYSPIKHTNNTQNDTHNLDRDSSVNTIRVNRVNHRLDCDPFDNQYDTKNDDCTYNNDTYDNDTKDDITMNDDILINDEDEIPLELLRNRKGKMRKSRKKKKIGKEMQVQNKDVTISSNLKEDPDIKLEIELMENRGEKLKKRTKKEPREGFTSRMVQETDEYIVIKLTKEQVSEEMKERSKTDSYQKSPFRCEKCIKGFNFEDVLQTHMEKHSEKNGKFQCDMCGQYCPSAVSLRGHVKSHTTRYKCKLCGHIRLSRQHLLEHHAITHTSAATAYNCDFCKFTTNKRTVMQRHVRRHAGGEPYACHKCGKMFKSIESLRLHTARHDKSPRHRCPHCGAMFVYHSLLRRHVECVHERRDYYCVECDVQFKCAESLRLHFKKAKKHRDSSSSKHVCAHCPSRFFTAASLAVHLSAVHNEPKSHPCPHCRRLYSSRDAVRAHAWRVHARGDTKVACPHCGDHFARASTLKVHIRSHSGSRHACRCGATFALDKTLQAHLLDKHKDEDLNKIEV